MEEAEALKKLGARQEVQADPAKMLGPDVRIADQKLQVCDICGAFLSIYDSDWRLADHFGGKLHLGYMQILFLQALYFCVPFRDQLLEHASRSKNVGEADENLLTCLSELFTQDAHEFLNFLLNALVGILEKEAKASSRPTSGHQVYPEKLANGIANGVANGNGNHQQHSVTWVHKIFQGTLTNETRCLRCETSEKRAQDLWTQLAAEERRCLDLVKFVKELLPTQASTALQPLVLPPPPLRPMMGPQDDQQLVSQCLDADAQRYFDECVSLAGLDLVSLNDASSVGAGYEGSVGYQESESGWSVKDMPLSPQKRNFVRADERNVVFLQPLKIFCAQIEQNEVKFTDHSMCYCGKARPFHKQSVRRAKTFDAEVDKML
ncbi:unnamed protein product [Calypogeia fissa]